MVGVTEGVDEDDGTGDLAFFLLMRTVKLTERAAGTLPEGRSSRGVGMLDCHKLYGGDLILSLLF